MPISKTHYYSEITINTFNSRLYHSIITNTRYIFSVTFSRNVRRPPRLVHHILHLVSELPSWCLAP